MPLPKKLFFLGVDIAVEISVSRFGYPIMKKPISRVSDMAPNDNTDFPARQLTMVWNDEFDIAVAIMRRVVDLSFSGSS